jgi:hypothetical protein
MLAKHVAWVFAASNRERTRLWWCGHAAAIAGLAQRPLESKLHNSDIASFCAPGRAAMRGIIICQIDH